MPSLKGPSGSLTQPPQLNSQFLAKFSAINDDYHIHQIRVNRSECVRVTLLEEEKLDYALPKSLHLRRFDADEETFQQNEGPHLSLRDGKLEIARFASARISPNLPNMKHGQRGYRQLFHIGGG